MAPWRDPTTGPVGTRAFGWALAAHVLVAAALSISEGHDQPVADVLVFLSVAAVGLGLHGTKTDEGAWPFAHALTWVVALVSIACAGLVSPGVYLESQTPLLPFFGLNALAAAIIASYGLDLFTRARIPAWIARARRVGMLAAALGVAAWVLWACPAPRIDVWVLDQQAADALLHGRRVYGHGHDQGRGRAVPLHWRRPRPRRCPWAGRPDARLQIAWSSDAAPSPSTASAEQSRPPRVARRR